MYEHTFVTSKIRTETQYDWHFFQKSMFKVLSNPCGWWSGSIVKNTCYSSRGLKFGSGTHIWRLTTAWNSSPEDMVPSSGLCRCMHPGCIPIPGFVVDEWNKQVEDRKYKHRLGKLLIYKWIFVLFFCSADKWT